MYKAQLAQGLKRVVALHNEQARNNLQHVPLGFTVFDLVTVHRVLLSEYLHGEHLFIAPPKHKTFPKEPLSMLSTK